MKYLLFFVIIFIGCKERNYNSEYEDSEDYTTTLGYADGTYCAEVEYYYSKTGTQSTYILEVEIEGNDLTVIHWPNGGWLDSSHFSPLDISGGTASFTSDEGVDYTVTIIGDSGDCLTSAYAESEEDLIQQREDEETRLREEQEEEEERLQQEQEEMEERRLREIEDVEENE